MKKTNVLLGFACAAIIFATSTTAPITAMATPVPYENMYRMYNPNSGEHFYTASQDERNHLITIGWNYEGIAWEAPLSGTPVYRLYNPNSGDHFYTSDVTEKDHLASIGWNYEGIGWYSDDDKEIAVYREYNPNATIGTHNYTTDAHEDSVITTSQGWLAEGISWYGVNETALDVGTLPTNSGDGTNKQTGTVNPDGSVTYTLSDVTHTTSTTNADGSGSTTYYFN